MTTSQLSLLQSLIKELRTQHDVLEQQGKSFNPSSLFSAVLSLTDPNHSHSQNFEKIIEICEKLKNVNEMLQFCETLLKKVGSNEQLSENEETFLEYISMVSQILGMTSGHQMSTGWINTIFSNYTRAIDSLIKRLSERFEAFMNYMTYSFYWQRMVSDKKRSWEKKNSGSPSKNRRMITDKDKVEIEQKRGKKDEETTRLSDEHDEMTTQTNQLLERLSQFFSLISKTIEKFGLKDFPAISFYLSGFNSEQFNQFRDEFQIIHQTFQSLKTDIDEFGQHAESLRTMYLEEYNKSDEFLNKWNSSLNGTAFLGKQD